MWHFGEGMGWWMLFGGTWMFVFWGVIIGVVVWAVIAWSRRNRSGGKDDSLSIARERYARGEMSREEFEQIKKDLSWVTFF